MPYTDVTVNNLVVNVLTQDEYDSIQDPSNSELYLITDDAITPAQAVEDVATVSAVGTSTQYARADHVHAITGTAITSALGYTPGQGTLTDSQVNGTSIVSNGVANLVTNTAYNASTNKLATMSDVDDAVAGVTAPVTSVNTKTGAVVLTASDVGALPDSTVIPAAQVQSDWNATTGMGAILNKPTIPTVPSNVSAFTNDAGYLTSYTETDPVYSASAAAGITAGDISNWNAKSDFSGSYEDLTNKPTIPTVPTNVSAFTNDAGYLTSYTETDPVYTASAAAGITSTDITNWNSKTDNTGTVTSVRVQATSPVQSSVNTAQTGTLNTTISLASGYGDTQNPYASKTAKYVLAAPNAQNGAPTFRALVSSDLPSIGNITNAGDITANATIASGDRLVINDESASKVTNSSITFGTNTKQYLANNGTWQNAYDDTALAARVQALEDLEWATYYSGRQNPASSLGIDGDIYLQY